MYSECVDYNTNSLKHKTCYNKDKSIATNDRRFCTVSLWDINTLQCKTDAAAKWIRASDSTLGGQGFETSGRSKFSQRNNNISCTVHHVLSSGI